MYNVIITDDCCKAYMCVYIQRLHNSSNSPDYMRLLIHIAQALRKSEIWKLQTRLNQSPLLYVSTEKSLNHNNPTTYISWENTQIQIDHHVDWCLWT